LTKQEWVGLKRFESCSQVGYNLPITKPKLILITVRFSQDRNLDDNDTLPLYPDATRNGCYPARSRFPRRRTLPVQGENNVILWTFRSAL